MGNPLFGIDVSGLVNQHIGSGLLPATLVKVTPGTRTAGQLTGGTNPTEVSHACRGMIDTQAVRTLKDGTLAIAGKKTIMLIGDSIAGGTVFPEPLDKIVIEGTTYLISEGAKIDRDPAKATYTCEVTAF